MKFKIRQQDENLIELERILDEHLIPVRPRPEFVSGLRQKLGQITPEPPVLPRGWRTLIVSTAGIFSGLLIAGVVVRTIAGLVGTINLVRQIRSIKANKAASATPA